MLLKSIAVQKHQRKRKFLKLSEQEQLVLCEVPVLTEALWSPVLGPVKNPRSLEDSKFQGQANIGLLHLEYEPSKQEDHNSNDKPSHPERLNQKFIYSQTTVII
jgi:hypothetical protein